MSCFAPSGRLIANAPCEEIALERADGHRVELKSGKVTYRIGGMPGRGFPKAPDHRRGQGGLR